MTSIPAAPPARVPALTLLAFGAMSVPVASVGIIFAVYLPRHYVSLGVGFAAVAAAITIVRLVDVFLDPVVALLMDRTKTPIGRYRPWLLLGAPLLMLGVYKLLMPSGPVGEAYLIVWLLVGFAGLSLTTLGLTAWSAALATTYNDRSRLYGWTTAMGVTGAVAFLLLPILSGGKISAGMKSSMPVLGLMLLVVIPIAVAITATFTPDRKAAARPKFGLEDYRRAIARPSMLRLMLADMCLALGPGMTGPLYVYYFHDVKGLTIADCSLLLIPVVGAGIVGAPFWGWLARRLGKHRAVQIGCLCYALAQSALMAWPRLWAPYTWLDALPTMIGAFLVGFSSSGYILLIRAMVADVADEVKLEQKVDLTSVLFSMVTTTTKIGASITVAIVFPVLSFVHYNGDEGAVNTPGAIFGLEMCYLFAPIIFVFIGAAMLFGYKLDNKRHAEIRLALEARDFAASEEAITGMRTGPPMGSSLAAQ